MLRGRSDREQVWTTDAWVLCTKIVQHTKALPQEVCRCILSLFLIGFSSCSNLAQQDYPQCGSMHMSRGWSIPRPPMRERDGCTGEYLKCRPPSLPTSNARTQLREQGPSTDYSERFLGRRCIGADFLTEQEEMKGRREVEEQEPKTVIIAAEYICRWKDGIKTYHHSDSCCRQSEGCQTLVVCGRMDESGGRKEGSVLRKRRMEACL